MSALAPGGSVTGEFVRPPRQPTWLRPVLARLRPTSRPAAEAVALPAPAAVAIATMVIISVLAAWLLLYAFVFSGMQAARENTVRYATLRENLSGATTPIGGVIKPGTPIALLRAPSLGLPDEVIVEGTGPGDLRSGPGHLRTTPLPGQAGVSVIYGRSATFGGPFAHLKSLTKGDRLTVTTGQGTFTYAVDGVRRPGDPLPSQLAPNGSRLLLETSSGFGFGSANTLVADATLVAGQVAPTPAGRPSSVPGQERAMQSDTSVLLPLVLWLQALVLVGLGVVWAWRSWGLWQAWLLGIPLVTAVLWGASSTALMLLPNLT